jgi:hypothetical protein
MPPRRRTAASPPPPTASANLHLAQTVPSSAKKTPVKSAAATAEPKAAATAEPKTWGRNAQNTTFLSLVSFLIMLFCPVLVLVVWAVTFRHGGQQQASIHAVIAFGVTSICCESHVLFWP